MHVFIIILDGLKFESIPGLRTPLESGFPLMYQGKEAVVLGSGSTRAEAKARGTEYYNRVCKWHGEDCVDWNFQTQDPTDVGSSDNKGQDRSQKRESEESAEPKSKRHKRSS
ncbi:2,3-bisphosphoglycerate-dependent phosphoglycerate mutase [Frankliniella fusca]|uniref:2,3-bisphosphoglycerate-dependent phosphoglycerate mutase n=1 Tax=Frankliniella fusca TaxID=407009 RepID=A0AAE1I4E4_9NEOP|nr:2,3-bisphosphoglycerate-dependent phosphoglycerate mutase [Frankliniella fusca]